MNTYYILTPEGKAASENSAYLKSKPNYSPILKALAEGASDFTDPNGIEYGERDAVIARIIEAEKEARRKRKGVFKSATYARDPARYLRGYFNDPTVKPERFVKIVERDEEGRVS